MAVSTESGVHGSGGAADVSAVRHRCIRGLSAGISGQGTRAVAGQEMQRTGRKKCDLLEGVVVRLAAFVLDDIVATVRLINVDLAL